MDTLSKLNSVIRKPDGSLVRGAISRIAERCSVRSKTTVRRWLSGEWVMPEKARLQLDIAMAKGYSFAAHKPGPKQERRQRSRK